jgi:hypothetical protein
MNDATAEPARMSAVTWRAGRTRRMAPDPRQRSPLPTARSEGRPFEPARSIAGTRQPNLTVDSLDRVVQARIRDEGESAVTRGPLGKLRAAAALGRSALLALVMSACLMAIDDRVAASQPGRMTARIGISAGAAIEDAPLGLRGQGLRQRIPVLFETVDRLDVAIETVSVGQGFFACDGLLLSRKDLDLTVTGDHDQITAMAATLGKAFDQSVVFVWSFESAGAQATATIPLVGGATSLTTAVYEQLIAELAGGGHVRSAGDHDLIFVANTGDEPEAAFRARMLRVRALLNRAGIPTRPVRFERAGFVAIGRDAYDGHIIAGSPHPARDRCRDAARSRLPRSRWCADAGFVTGDEPGLNLR